VAECSLACGDFHFNVSINTNKTIVLFIIDNNKNGKSQANGEEMENFTSVSRQTRSSYNLLNIKAIWRSWILP
jgi:hypothetical protein